MSLFMFPHILPGLGRPLFLLPIIDEYRQNFVPQPAISAVDRRQFTVWPDPTPWIYL